MEPCSGEVQGEHFEGVVQDDQNGLKDDCGIAPRCVGPLGDSNKVQAEHFEGGVKDDQNGPEDGNSNEEWEYSDEEGRILSEDEEH